MVQYHPYLFRPKELQKRAKNLTKTKKLLPGSHRRISQCCAVAVAPSGIDLRVAMCFEDARHRHNSRCAETQNLAATTHPKASVPSSHQQVCLRVVEVNAEYVVLVALHALNLLALRYQK